VSGLKEYARRIVRGSGWWFIYTEKAMPNEYRKRRLAEGLCVWCGESPHEAGRTQCRPCADLQLAKVKARNEAVAANGGKPLRKAETNEETARAIERQKNDIRAIRRLYWECHLTVSEIAEQSQGKYSEQWIQDCVLYRFERVLV
jgi:hypothetical protein